MQLTLKQVIELKPLTDEHLATATREELLILLRGEQALRDSLGKAFADALTRELVLKDQVFESQQKYCRLRTLIFDTRSEKSQKNSSNKKYKKKKDKKKADDTTKLPSERYPNVPIIKRVVDCIENPFCPCCGEKTKPSGMYSVSECLTVIPKKFIIIRQMRQKYACSDCFSGIVTTPAPPRIVKGSSYGDELIIDVTLNKYCDLVPVERYCRIASMGGVEGLPPNSLIETTHKLADLFEPNYEATKAETLSERVLQADETTHRMLEGDKKKKWYLWGFSGKKSCFFEYHDTRSGDVASSLLNESKCEVLVSDVYAGYRKAVSEAKEYRENLGDERRIVNAYCNSHARRGFVDSAKEGDQAAQYMIDMYAECQKIENQAKGKPKEDVVSIRQALVPLFKKMKDFSELQRDQLSEKSTLGQAFGYFVNNYEGLTYFINDAETPLENNQSERLLRSAVIGRKTWSSRSGILPSPISHGTERDSLPSFGSCWFKRTSGQTALGNLS